MKFQRGKSCSCIDRNANVSGCARMIQHNNKYIQIRFIDIRPNSANHWMSGDYLWTLPRNLHLVPKIYRPLCNIYKFGD